MDTVVLSADCVSLFGALKRNRHGVERESICKG